MELKGREKECILMFMFIAKLRDGPKRVHENFQNDWKERTQFEAKFSLQNILFEPSPFPHEISWSFSLFLSFSFFSLFFDTSFLSLFLKILCLLTRGTTQGTFEGN